jgi:hypothetical protein
MWEPSPQNPFFNGYMSDMPTDFGTLLYQIATPVPAPITTNSTTRSSLPTGDIDSVRRLRAFINYLRKKTLNHYRKAAFKDAYIKLRKSLYEYSDLRRISQTGWEITEIPPAIIMAFINRKNRSEFMNWIDQGDNKNNVKPSKNDITNADEAEFARQDSDDIN